MVKPEGMDIKTFMDTLGNKYLMILSTLPPHSNQLASRVLLCKPGEMSLPGSDMCVSALLGMEYPDPMGSGLGVPVLGCQTDPVSGITLPLAGTMQDPDGKGTVKRGLLQSLILTQDI